MVIMKVGDKIFSTKIRCGEVATVVKADRTMKEFNDSDGKKVKEFRSMYKASYPDGVEFIFYGYNIGKSIFPFEEPDGQLDLSDFMAMPEC